MNQEFEHNGYFVVRDFFDNTTVKLMSTYFDIKRRLIEHGDKSIRYSTIDKGDFTNSYVLYADHLTESIMFNYGQKVCNQLGLNLSPTYTYARIYETGQSLLPHTDRPSCEVSATCPILLSDDKPSIIYVSKFTIEEANRKRFTLEEIMNTGAFTRVELFPGDVLFYKGCERYHWRLPLGSEYLVQFFMHFVQTNGKYAEYALDKRPYLGFEQNIK